MLALSPLLYLASVVHVPEVVVKEVKTCIVDFIWDGGSSKIAYDVMIQQIHDGGLKLIDFGEKVKALKTIWVKRMTDGSPQKWKAAPAIFYNTNNLSNFFSYNLKPVSIKSQFYQDIQHYWSQLQQIKLLTPNAIFNQIIWNNRYITIKNKTIIWNKWEKKEFQKLEILLMTREIFLIMAILTKHSKLTAIS